MIKYIEKDCMDFQVNLSKWKEAIIYTGELLERKGYINRQYIDDMIKIVEKNGPYIVVMSGIALAHARPMGNVSKNSISMVTFKNGIQFGHSMNDPVKIVFVIAAKSDEEHMLLFQEVANFLMNQKNIERIRNANCYSDVVCKHSLNEIQDGLIVSCYADYSINPYMDNSEAVACMAKSCVAGGASAIRSNLAHIKAIRAVVDVPLIGIQKIYKGDDPLHSSFRITPTMKEVDELVEAGVDGIAIDGTQRERYDDLTLKEFIHKIKNKYPDIFIIADISTLEEGIQAYQYGVDAVGTTLSGYTPYSKNPIVFGTLPSPDPDYEIITALKKAGVSKVIAEGRITNGYKMKKCLEAGAFAVVIGTSISEPAKIVKTILYDHKKSREEDEYEKL